MRMPSERQCNWLLQVWHLRLRSIACVCAAFKMMVATGLRILLFSNAESLNPPLPSEIQYLLQNPKLRTLKFNLITKALNRTPDRNHNFLDYKCIDPKNLNIIHTQFSLQLQRVAAVVFVYLSTSRCLFICLLAFFYVLPAFLTLLTHPPSRSV